MNLFGRPCPCGTGADYQVCCGPLHVGERPARTAEELMRSRYSAYACGEVEFEARFESSGRSDVVRERSRFERRAGRWFYVDADG